MTPDTPTVLQLESMLTMQHVLNSRIDPQYATANYAWMRAIRVECAELTEHLGYKWWKHQEPDIPAAAMELVDIWHFVMGAALAAAGGDIPAAAADLERSFAFPRMEVMDILGRRFTLNGLADDPHELTDVMSVFAGMGYTFPPLVDLLLPHVGLTWGTLHRHYLAKNALNLFRQAHGYAEGTYVKQWGLHEDNTVLQNLLDAMPDSALDAEVLFAQLRDSYAQWAPLAAE